MNVCKTVDISLYQFDLTIYTVQVNKRNEISHAESYSFK